MTETQMPCGALAEDEQGAEENPEARVEVEGGGSGGKQEVMQDTTDDDTQEPARMDVEDYADVMLILEGPNGQRATFQPGMEMVLGRNGLTNHLELRSADSKVTFISVDPPDQCPGRAKTVSRRLCMLSLAKDGKALDCRAEGNALGRIVIRRKGGLVLNKPFDDIAGVRLESGDVVLVMMQAGTYRGEDGHTITQYKTAPWGGFTVRSTPGTASAAPSCTTHTTTTAVSNSPAAAAAAAAAMPSASDPAAARLVTPYSTPAPGTATAAVQPMKHELQIPTSINIAFLTPDNILGCVDIVPDMTLDQLRSAIPEELDDDDLPPEPWKFRSALAPISNKQEKKRLVGDFLPTIVLVPSAPPPSALMTLPPQAAAAATAAAAAAGTVYLAQPLTQAAHVMHAPPAATPQAFATAPAALPAATQAAAMPPPAAVPVNPTQSQATAAAALPRPPSPPPFHDNYDDMMSMDTGGGMDVERQERGRSLSTDPKGDAQAAGVEGRVLRKRVRKVTVDSSEEEEEEEDDVIDDSSDEEHGRRPTRRGKGSTKQNKGQPRKRRRGADAEEEEDVLSLTSEKGDGDHDDDDDVVVLSDDEDGDGEQKDEEDLPVNEKYVKLDLTKVRGSCNALLERMKAALEGPGGGLVRDSERWTQEIEDTIRDSSLLDTKIGVVGDTGAGKSSLLNAVVGDEDALVTSGWRACTAVCTELSYLFDAQGYQAEIHFLSQEEWDEELNDLLREAVNDKGQLKRVFDGETLQAVAVDKLTMVYGTLSGMDITKAVLFMRTRITRMLGSVKRVHTNDVKQFRREVGPFVAQSDRAGQAYWPIIRKIVLRSSNWTVLKQGGVLVDLPGLRDANAARARVCEQYKKECSVLVICAPIHRAVDNRTAKDLLGESFKRHLLLDGRVTSLIFCATKADEVKPTEIDRDFHDPELESAMEVNETIASQLADLKRDLREKKSANNVVKDRRRQLREMLKELDTEIQEACERQETGSGGHGMDEDVMMLDGEGGGKTGEGSGGTEEQKEEEAAVVVELAALYEKKEDLERQLSEAMAVEEPYPASDVRALQREVNKVEVKRKRQQRTVNGMAAALRNGFSKKEIRRDFQQGLMDIKRKARRQQQRWAGGYTRTAAMEVDDSDDDDVDDVDDDDDGDNGGLDPESTELPVFTVSSNEYLRLSGRMKGDGDTVTFTKRVDTEIPLLQRHILQLTGERRMESLRTYLKKVQAVAETLFGALTDEGTDCQSTRKALKEYFDSRLRRVRQAITTERESGVGGLRSLIDSTIGKDLQYGATQAEQECMDIVRGWGGPKPYRRKGVEPASKSIHPSTYFWCVVREGSFASPTAGEILMNDEMAEPLLREIVNAWDQVLNHKVPALLQSFQSKLTSLLTDAFVKGYSSDLKALAVDAGRIERLTTTSSNCIHRKVQDAVAAISEHVSAQQRDLNRSLPGDVQIAMRPAYQASMGERGQGRTARIRNILDTHANKIKGEVFRGAAKDLHKRLIALVADLQQRFSKTETSIEKAIEGIYACLWAGQIDETSALAVRERLLPVLVGIARDLEALLCSDVGEPELVTFRVDERMREYEERRKAREEERQKRRQEVEKAEAEARQREQMPPQQEAETEEQRKAAEEQDARLAHDAAARAPAQAERDAPATVAPYAANTGAARSTAPLPPRKPVPQPTRQSARQLERGNGRAIAVSEVDPARLIWAQQKAADLIRSRFGGTVSMDHASVTGYTDYFVQYRTDLYEREKMAATTAPGLEGVGRQTSGQREKQYHQELQQQQQQRQALRQVNSTEQQQHRTATNASTQKPAPTTAAPAAATASTRPHASTLFSLPPTYTIITDDKDLPSDGDGDEDDEEEDEEGEGEYDDYDHGGEYEDYFDEEREEEYESGSEASRTAEVAAIAKLSGEVEEVKTVGVHEAVHERVKEAEDNGDIIDLCR